MKFFFNIINHLVMQDSLAANLASKPLTYTFLQTMYRVVHSYFFLTAFNLCIV